MRPPNKMIELNLPRSSGFAQRLTNEAAAGYAPDSHIPSNSRKARSEANDHANPVRAVTTDHATIDTVSTRRGPKRSASDPMGIWKRA